MTHDEQKITDESRFGLRVKEKLSVKESLDLLDTCAPVLDFYMNRSGQYGLFCLLTKAPAQYWDIISRVVVDSAGLPLSTLAPEELTLPVIVDAFGVLATWLENIEVNDIYAGYAQGVDGNYVLNLLSDIQNIEAHLSGLSIAADAPLSQADFNKLFLGAVKAKIKQFAG
jgi:hypothetical protein